MAVGASDKEQAGIILNSMKLERAFNPFLKPLSFDKWEVTGPGGRMRVFAADAGSVMGETLDLILLDEVTAWKKPDLFNSLISGRHKRPGSPFIIITNAGEKKTWQWDQLQISKASPSWFVWESPEYQHLAGWMTQESVKELKSRIPPGMAKRLFDNVWTDPSEESGWVTYAEALACLDTSLQPVFAGRPEVRYFAGIDYGPKRDRTVLVVLHREDDSDIYVDHMTIWQGSHDAKVQVSSVEDWIDNVALGQFHADLVVDPYQMEAVIQKYEHVNRVVSFEARGGKANYELAENLRSLIVNERLHYGPGVGTLLLPNGQLETLTNELSEVIAYPTSYGYRIDTPTKQTKDRRTVHDDRTVAIGMAALEAIRDQTGGVEPSRTAKFKQPVVTAAERASLAMERGEGWQFGWGEQFGATDWRESAYSNDRRR